MKIVITRPWYGSIIVNTWQSAILTVIMMFIIVVIIILEIRELIKYKKHSEKLNKNKEEKN